MACKSTSILFMPSNHINHINWEEHFVCEPIIMMGKPQQIVCPRSIILNFIKMLVLKLGSMGNEMGPYKDMYFGTAISQRTQTG